jgi:hypothetical protein
MSFDIVAAVTCSACAKAERFLGPPKISTERADNFGADKPVSSSTTRTARNSRIAALCNRSATSSASDLDMAETVS